MMPLSTGLGNQVGEYTQQMWCIGFFLSDISLLFKDGVMQFSIYYKLKEVSFEVQCNLWYTTIWQFCKTMF